MANNDLSKYIIPIGVIGLGVYLAPQIKDAFSGVGGGISTAAQGTGQGISSLAQGTGFGIGTGIAGLGTGVSTAGQGLGFGISDAATGLGTGISKLGTGAGDIFESVGDAGGGFIDKVGETGGSFLDIFQNTFQGTADTVENFFDGANNPQYEEPIRQNKSFSFSDTAKSIFTNPFISPLGFGISKVFGTAKDIVQSRSTPAKIQEGTVNSNSRQVEKKARATRSTSRSYTPAIKTTSNFSSAIKSTSSSTGIYKTSTGSYLDTKAKQSVTKQEAEKRNAFRSSTIGKLLYN